MKYYLGVDLGGTNIAAGIVSDNGYILYKKSIKTQREREYAQILKDLAELCLLVIKDFKIKVSDIKYLGIGTPGKVDDQKGIIVYANNIKFFNAPAREEIQKTINLPVHLENDANCAALGESVCGAAKGYNDSVTITLGTGVGGGIILNGKILNGSFGSGGEVGHHVINVDGEPCTCGRRGCWEAYASATALIRDAKKTVAKNPQSSIINIVNGDLEKVDAKIIFDAADSGDDTAKTIIDKYLKNVACGMANIISIIQPEIIVIGGGICAQKDVILEPIKEYTSKMVYSGEMLTKFAIATLGNDAGIIGAAMQKR